MADPLWFSVVQTAGIVGGLVFYGITCQQQAGAQREQADAQRQQARAQETQNLIAFSERHRAFWREAYRNPELQRVFSVTARAESLSTIEEEFINEALVFYEVSWRIVKNSYQEYLKPLAKDLARFLSFPLALATWNKTREVRDEQFAEFVRGAIEHSERF